MSPALATILQLILLSGRVNTLAVETPSERVSPPQWIAPGAPPLLAFRYLEGQARHRFGNFDLVVDDAGH
jgi:hypothetical protein